MIGSMPQVKIGDMKIEAILFDLGKVLIDFNMQAMLQTMAASCSKSAAQLEEVFRDPELICSYESGTITTRQFYEHLCHCGGLQLDMPAFCQMWTSIFTADLLVSEDLLRQLRERYPLILVSNTNESHAEYVLQRYPILDYFDDKVFSFEVGAMKPDRRIYERAIELSGKQPQALFFTDDREENVRGARELGIVAHQFQSEARLIAALQDAGVELGDILQRNPLYSQT
jgi:putative hydrolase of the HAD superfamily